MVYGLTQLAPVATEALIANSAVNAEIAASAASRASYTQAALTQQVANLRATLPGSAKTGGNFGVAQIEIPGIQRTMAASSQIDLPNSTQQLAGFVGLGPEIFPSFKVGTGGANPIDLLRNVDSEAKILNAVAQQLGENRSASGTIYLLTERSPCASCSGIISQFKQKYPGIDITILDNGGYNIKPTKK